VLPVRGLDVRTVALLGVGVLEAVPWLSLAWLVHAECRTIRTLTGLDTADARHAAVLRLGRLWKRAVSCVTAFAVAVIGAMATTGVMRAVFLHAYPDRKSEFPPGYVLLYGFPFLMAVLIISAPLIAAWRSAGTHVLDHAVPIPDTLDLTDTWCSRSSPRSYRTWRWRSDTWVVDSVAIARPARLSATPTQAVEV
jgi:hypothetical protein